MIKKGDNVIVISGKDKGKKGAVLKVLKATSRVVVEGVNVHKKHVRATRSGAKGQTIEKQGTIHISNVMAIDPKGGKATRLGKRKVGDKFVRVAVRSGQEL